MSARRRAHRYVAFLRAINVGGRVVRMEKLKSAFEGLGHSAVSTFIASGNVVFSSPVTDAVRLERQIERGLAQALGFDVATFIRTLDEVATVAEYRPFGARGGSATLYVGLLREVPSKTTCSRVLALRTVTDELHVRGRELYWLCATPSLQSIVSGAVLEKTLGMPATLRNMNTIRRLAARFVES